MTTQQIFDYFMQSSGPNDDAKAAVLRLLEIVDNAAGNAPAAREETPENRRIEAAEMLLAYFAKKHPAR